VTSASLSPCGRGSRRLYAVDRAPLPRRPAGKLGLIALETFLRGEIPEDHDAGSLEMTLEILELADRSVEAWRPSSRPRTPQALETASAGRGHGQLEGDGYEGHARVERRLRLRLRRRHLGRGQPAAHAATRRQHRVGGVSGHHGVPKHFEPIGQRPRDRAPDEGLLRRGAAPVRPGPRGVVDLLGQQPHGLAGGACRGSVLRRQGRLLRR